MYHNKLHRIGICYFLENTATRKQGPSKSKHKDIQAIFPHPQSFFCIPLLWLKGAIFFHDDDDDDDDYFFCSLSCYDEN